VTIGVYIRERIEVAESLTISGRNLRSDRARRCPPPTGTGWDTLSRMNDEQHARMMRLSVEFGKVHAGGMAALKAGDDEGFGAAIAQERDLIQQQSDLLTEARTGGAPRSGPDSC
jgi:hypothetical protein